MKLLQKSIWLRGSRFPSTYLNLPAQVTKSEEEKNEITRKVSSLVERNLPRLFLPVQRHIFSITM